MKKILLLLDAENYKAEMLDFTAAIAKPARSTVVGLFFEHPHLASAPSMKTLGGQVYVEEIVEDPAIKQRKLAKIESNIELFKSGCLLREINGLVHRDGGDPLELLIEESRYADLIIIDPASSFNGDKRVPSRFVMDVLAKAECPVLISPEYFDQLDEIVFAFDGSSSATYAIRQFQYQLPHLAHKKITILHVSEDGRLPGAYEKQKALFSEWLNLNFSNVSFIELTGYARDILFEYFMEQNPRFNKMLVTGAFGRSFLSTFLKPSTADLVLKAVDIPIFVCHY